ncbi:MAG: protein serine/threonine phosphatase [Bacteroidota bacterium]|jgi:serine phosphatase RsbU (regulator of sigma subunit)/Tfp pilus assembly protein PilF|nr:protein serine/threonine phosphatase [Bacteroidota bacterium]
MLKLSLHGMPAFLLRILILILFPATLVAQSNNTDAISKALEQLQKSKTEKARLDAFSQLAWLYRKTNTALAEQYSDSTIQLAKRMNDHELYWVGLNSKAEALRLGANFEKALIIHQEALNFSEAKNLMLEKAHSLNNIGLILKRLKNLKDAKDYISRAREVYKSIHDTDGIITTSTNLGNCIIQVEEYPEAIAYYHEVINLATPRNDLSSLGNAYTNIAHCYYYMKNSKKAKDYYYRGLKIREKAGIPMDIVDSYGNYGYMLYEEGNYEAANTYYQQALLLTRPTGDKDNLIDLYSFLADLALAKKDFKSAYYYADSSRIYKDSVINARAVESVNEMNKKFESEKKQLKIEKLSTENAYKEKVNASQRLFLLIVAIALIISLMLGAFVFKLYQEKKTANHIIHSQKESLEEKQKEIIDSISYAKHLQQAILPTDTAINESFPENFVLYKPKDIVAGDFYWLENKQHLKFIAAADCTGHGVPGAMVSVVCSNALHRVVKEFNLIDTGEILNKTRELVLETFTRNNKDVKDGMDISLACFNSNTCELFWSGANNPLWYFQNNALKEITADKQPIGKTDYPKPFTTHRIQLVKGDIFYLFTDGYADQFGGPKGKKLKYKPLKELLTENSQEAPDIQKQKLEKLFNDWKGDLEQVDDVCIIGIKV